MPEEMYSGVLPKSSAASAATEACAAARPARSPTAGQSPENTLNTWAARSRVGSTTKQRSCGTHRLSAHKAVYICASKAGMQQTGLQLAPAN